VSIQQSAQDEVIRGRPPAPDILIHMHIPKTGGTSLNSMIQHAFPDDEVSDTMVIGSENYNGLGLAPFESCRKRFELCSPDELRRIRYVTGHLPMGLHRAFDRPAEYFTVIRHPVDRVISDFFFRIQEKEPYVKDGRLLTLDEYVECRNDVYLCDYQVRVISGSAELEAERQPMGMPTPGRPVEDRHLEQAKRNIETHFLTIAPLENMTELALLIRSVYGWPMRRLLNETKNRTKQRLLTRDVSPRTIKIIEESNSHDLQLHEWVGKRFAAQRELFEPSLSKDNQIFGLLSQGVNIAGRVLPWNTRKRLAQLLFYA
jgi:sulfotransferase famil protein